MNSQQSQYKRENIGATEDEWVKDNCQVTTHNTLLTGYETRTWEWKMDGEIDAPAAVKAYSEHNNQYKTVQHTNTVNTHPSSHRYNSTQSLAAHMHTAVQITDHFCRAI